MPRQKKTQYTPPVPLSEKDFKEQLKAIYGFPEGGGESLQEPGKHLDVSGKSLPSTATLTNRDLRYASFRGAGLPKQNFGKANVTHADFGDADLSEADLSQVVGLQANQLSGADLSRAKLPADVAKFDMLANVTTLSQNAGKMFLTTLLACIFVLLTAFTTGDIQLLTNSGTAELPVLKVGVSTQLFFGIAPLVLLILSVTVHLYLQRLWEAMAQLPAVFPDGTTADNKTHPWLINDLIRTGFPLLGRPEYNTPLAWMQLRALIAIAYGTVPATLLIVFLRCLPRHDPWLSGWQTALFALSLAWASLVSYLNQVTLRRLKPEREDFLRHRPRALWRPAAWLTGALAVGFLLILYACKGTPLILSSAQKDQVVLSTQLSNKYLQGSADALYRIEDPLRRIEFILKNSKSRDEREELQKRHEELQSSRKALLGLSDDFAIANPFAPWNYPVLKQFALSSYAEQPSAVHFPAFSPGNIVEDSTQLTDKLKPGEVEFPRPPLPHVARLTSEELADETAKGKLGLEDYVVPRAEQALYDSKLKKWHDTIASIVKRVSFQGMNLRFLQARGAFLVNADFRGADMTCADFSEADFRNAIFRSESMPNIEFYFANLNEANLDGANLNGARLIGARLIGARLIGADLIGADLIGADLIGADLIGVELYGADLSEANLENAKLYGADLTKASLRGANLDGAKLTGAHLDGAYYDRSHKPYWPDGRLPKGWREQSVTPKDAVYPKGSDLIKLVAVPEPRATKPSAKAPSSAKQTPRNPHRGRSGARVPPLL